MPLIFPSIIVIIGFVLLLILLVRVSDTKPNLVVMLGIIDNMSFCYTTPCPLLIEECVVVGAPVQG